jgi:hypothetical protein
MQRAKKKTKAKLKAKSKAKPKEKAKSKAKAAKAKPTAPAKLARKSGAVPKKAAPKPDAPPPKPRPAVVATGQPASELIDQRILDVAGWRGETLARMRTLIREADPAVIEEWKWDVPVWSHDGIVCTGEVYQNVVKLTFAHGAAVDDPSHLFNSSLQGNTRRAIDIHEGETVDAAAFKELFTAAAARNTLAKRS